MGASVKKTSAGAAAWDTKYAEKWPVCVCVCLLSKWSCLCLKVDCRLVLSLETGALISVWLCWLSFSSISTVQQEKPCGHTFNGAPGRDEGDAALHTGSCPCKLERNNLVGQSDSDPLRIVAGFVDA